MVEEIMIAYVRSRQWYALEVGVVPFAERTIQA